MSPVAAFLALLALPLISSPVIYLGGRVAVRMGRPASLSRILALAAAALAWIPLVIAGQAVLRSGAVEASVGSVSLRMDGISLLLAGAVLLLGSLVLVFSVPYMRGEEGEEKYYALLLATMGAMIGLGCANDLFNLWVWFEAVAISSYLLVAFYRDEPGAIEAGVKYLVQSAAGSALVLIGIALVFAQTGTLKLDEITAAPYSPVMLAAGALFLTGFGVKTALVPLHTWLPDAHSQAPSGISAMLSGVVIEAGLVAMLRTVGSLPGNANSASTWGWLLLGAGALNILVGNLMALRQTQVKRLLAYSSLAHMGYMVIGFGAAAGFHLPDAAAGGFFHLFNHTLMKGLAFLSAGALLFSLRLSKGDHAPLTVDDLDGAAQKYPLTAFALSIAVLALGGLPPLAGFMSKWQIFVSDALTLDPAVIAFVVFAALNSVLSLGYYAPLVNRMYRREPSPAVQSGGRVSVFMALPLVILVAAVSAFGFWPSLASGLTGPAAQALMRLFAGS